MNSRQLTSEEIRDIAFRTTGQSHNSDWKSYRYGKLTSSKFGRAISVMRNPHPTNLQRLRDELYVPKNLDHVPAIRWGLDHESVAIDAYQNKTDCIVKPTGVWMFHNNVMGASPDGLVFTDPHGACAVGILEVKCPYSMRDVKVEYPAKWHNYLNYLDCNNNLKKTHDYYHQIQGAMAAVGVEWCDFVIWTPSNMKIQRIRRDEGWSMRYVPQLESFYKHQITRKEDFDEGFSEAASGNTDEEPIQPYEHPARDLTSILHPIGPAGQYLRHMMTQCLHVHLSRWIYHMQSVSRSGHKWRKAVDQHWALAVENICEGCVRKMFRQKDQRDYVHRALLDEVADIIHNILDDSSIWSELLFDPDFASMLKARVRSVEPSMDMRLAPCTCYADKTTSLRYQATFRMPPRSNAGLVPNYQDQLDAPMSEAFPKLKQARQPPMLKYERQLAVDERYHSTLYKD